MLFLEYVTEGKPRQKKKNHLNRDSLSRTKRGEKTTSFQNVWSLRHALIKKRI